MEWLTTSTILHRLRDFENRDAWDRLCERFRRPLTSFARRLGIDAASAEDVAQDTLVAFAESFRRGVYDPAKGRLSHWLFGIAYRQALGARRTAGRAAAGEDGSFWANVPDEATASSAWDEEWERTVFDECLIRARQEVEPATFRAFELVVLHDRTADEAARELGVPIKTVYNAKHRLLKRIRELRADYEDSFTPAR